MHAGPEACAAHPESCQIDRVSVMNEDGECSEHQCAEGYGGELCNSKFTFRCFYPSYTDSIVIITIML